MKRILATLITSIALAVGMTAFAGAPAHAGYDSNEVSGAKASTHDRADAAAAKRRVTIKFKPTSGGSRFQFSGYVKPAGKCANNKIVRLQYKANKSQAWKIFRNGRSNSNGFYAFRNLNQAGFFRAVAPKQFKCAYATSKAIRVVKQ